MNKKIIFGLLLLSVVALGMPGALAATSVDYPTTIQPIFNSYCTMCHGASSPSAGYSLTSYTGAMTGGKVIAGNSAGSTLYQEVNSGGMPLGGASLSAAEIQSIADWINQGALATAPAPANTAPVANGQTVTTSEGTLVAVTLNASDADANMLNYTVVSNPAHGTLSGTAPALTYTPAAGFNGSDSFTFKANDGTVDSNTAIVSITVTPVTPVTPVNHAPVANNQSVTTTEGTPVAAILNATDADANTLNYTVVSNPTNGTLSGTAPALTYTPAAGFNGSDSFTFKANDGTADSNIATVSITVTPVTTSNTEPAANAQSVTTIENTSVAVTLTATGGNTLTYTVVSNPLNGTLSGTAPALTYTPDTGFNGTDSFTFKVNNGTVESNIATVSITVTASTYTLEANGSINGSASITVSNTSKNHEYHENVSENESENEVNEHNGTHQNESDDESSHQVNEHKGKTENVHKNKAKEPANKQEYKKKIIESEHKNRASGNSRSNGGSGSKNKHN